MAGGYGEVDDLRVEALEDAEVGCAPGFGYVGAAAAAAAATGGHLVVVVY